MSMLLAIPQAAGPQYQEQGSQTAQTGLGPRSPSITITFGNSPQVHCSSAKFRRCTL